MLRISMRMGMVTLVRMAIMQVQVLWREESLEKPLCEAQTMVVSEKYPSPEKLHLFSQVFTFVWHFLKGLPN